MSNSIGNLKNSGLQGNNFPWQLKMLQGLQAIYDEVKLPLTCVEDSVTICGPANGLDVNVHDGAGNSITSTVVGPDRGIDVNIIGPIGQQGINTSVSSAISSDQANVAIIPMLIEVDGIATGDLTAYSSNSLLSISFASRGSTYVSISVNGGNSYVKLLPGETLTLDANGIMNYYDPSLFYWNSPSATGALLIAFNYI